MSAETLAAIVAEDQADAATVAGAAPGAAPAEAVPAGPTLAEEIGGLISLAVKVLSPALPCLAGIYTDEVTAAASGAVGALCEKHGWLSGGIGGEYKEELAVLFVVGPLAVQTVMGVRADIAKNKKTSPAAAGEAEQVSAPAIQSGPVPLTPDAPGMLARG